MFVMSEAPRAPSFRDRVRAYWEKEPCGTTPLLTGDVPRFSSEWFLRIEERRYEAEPYIHSFAQFTRQRGKRVLEIGVGAGTDHLQWARAGAHCFGMDLTDAALETTRRHLALHGFEAKLLRADAEQLPYASDTFDVVYSWGVLHHADVPARTIEEVRRVLKPDGRFIGMLYGRHSPLVLKAWVRHALLAGKPWRRLTRVVADRIQSGAKAYTTKELAALYARYSSFRARPTITIYDTARFPAWLSRYFPDDWGWFIAIDARK